MIHYSQQDPKWKNKTLGDSDLTIGDAGCFLTCFAMLLEVEPDKVNERVKIFGGFAGGLLSAGVVPNAYTQIGVTQTWCTNNPAPLDVIDSALSNRQPVIVQVDTSPVLGIQSHFVILTGKVGNDYSMVDPWPLVDEPPATLLGRYGKGRDAATIITYIAVIGGVELENESQNVNSTQSEGNTTPSPIAPVLSLPSASQGIVEVADGEWCYLRTAHNTNNDPVCKVYPGKSFATTGQEFSEGGHDWVEVKCYMAKEYLK